MNDIELRLRETVERYTHLHQNPPKSVSLSIEFFHELHQNNRVQTMILNNGRDYGSYWHGFSLKFVKRKNYMEAMPRKRRAKISPMPYHCLMTAPSFTTMFAPAVAMPKMSGLITSS